MYLIGSGRLCKIAAWHEDLFEKARERVERKSERAYANRNYDEFGKWNRVIDRMDARSAHAKGWMSDRNIKDAIDMGWLDKEEALTKGRQAGAHEWFRGKIRDLKLKPQPGAKVPTPAPAPVQTQAPAQEPVTVQPSEQAPKRRRNRTRKPRVAPQPATAPAPKGRPFGFRGKLGLGIGAAGLLGAGGLAAHHFLGNRDGE